MIRCTAFTFIGLLPAICIAQTGTPVTLARATQYDLTSKISNQSYRISVSTPFNAQSEIAYPVVYLLDGNQYFATATDIVTRLSYLKTAGSVAPAIVVGIGYPTDDPREILGRRALD